MHQRILASSAAEGWRQIGGREGRNREMRRMGGSRETRCKVGPVLADSLVNYPQMTDFHKGMHTRQHPL